MKRKFAHITSRKCAKSPCPNCHTKLDGFTGAMIGERFSEPLFIKGRPTMCAYCGALLVFADNRGRVRAMTEAERDSAHFAPIVEKLYAGWREKARAGAEKFTRRVYN
jgi:hypothetical protein